MRCRPAGRVLAKQARAGRSGHPAATAKVRLVLLQPNKFGCNRTRLNIITRILPRAREMVNSHAISAISRLARAVSQGA